VEGHLVYSQVAHGGGQLAGAVPHSRVRALVLPPDEPPSCTHGKQESQRLPIRGMRNASQEPAFPPDWGTMIHVRVPLFLSSSAKAVHDTPH